VSAGVDTLGGEDHRTVPRTIRYGTAVAAVVICAWFVLGARQAHEIDAASQLLANHAGDASRATPELKSAAFLYPGNDVRILQAQLDLKRRRYAAARRLIAKAIAKEPEDLNAWIAALDLAVDDPAVENTNRVFAHLRMLDPIDFRNRRR
jgi:hypothetical protein